MRYVVDASVAIKWFFQSAPDEEDADAAVTLLRANRNGLADFYQPPHFVAEVAAVLARKKPDEAQADLGDLLDIEFRLIEDATIHQTALDLAIRLNHHLFDTLYHAVALHTPRALLVTADRRYFTKAEPIGHILLLNNPLLTRPRASGRLTKPHRDYRMAKAKRPKDRPGTRYTAMADALYQQGDWL